MTRFGCAADENRREPSEAAVSSIDGLELLWGVPEPEAGRIGALLVERRFPQGSRIFAPGDPGDSVFILQEGLVKLLTVSHKEAETLLHILKPGEIFGELIFTEEARAFTAVAVTDVTVSLLSRADLIGLLAAVPALALNFIRLLSRRLVKMERIVAEFGHTWSYHRLARGLLRLADEHGIPTPSGVLIPFPITHVELAKLIGTTRETVTAQLIRFRKDGLLRREGRHFVVNRSRLVDFIRSKELRIDDSPA
jgi:CRP-like cAMP-binding protein